MDTVWAFWTAAHGWLAWLTGFEKPMLWLVVCAGVARIVVGGSDSAPDWRIGLGMAAFAALVPARHVATWVMGPPPADTLERAVGRAFVGYGASGPVGVLTVRSHSGIWPIDALALDIKAAGAWFGADMVRAPEAALMVALKMDLVDVYGKPSTNDTVRRVSLKREDIERIAWATIPIENVIGLASIEAVAPVLRRDLQSWCVKNPRWAARVCTSRWVP